MKPRQRPARQSWLHVRLPGGTADCEDEDIDEIESLPRDAEHDEEERDPDPERYAAPSEHAQERRRRHQAQARRKHLLPR